MSETVGSGTMIHETAVVDDDAVIGQNVRIGPFAHIEAGTTIGDGCVIGPHVVVKRFTSLGSECQVHAGAVLGDIPQDTGFENGESFVRIGPKCLIREGVTVHRGTKTGTATEIGEGCFLMAFSHCAHNVRLGRQVIMANGALLGGYVEVGDRAFISGHCMVHQFVKIGRVAMLGGGCGASKDVPPFFTLRPMVLNTVAGLNVVGMRRAGLSPDERKEIKEAFKILYRSGLNVSEARDRIRKALTSAPALEIAEFIERSSRGICVASNQAGEDDPL